MYQPMKSNTLRQGKRLYGFSGTNSPNFKGATAVRPDDSFKDLQRTLGPIKYEPKKLHRAIGRRLDNGSTGRSGRIY